MEQVTSKELYAERTAVADLITLSIERESIRNCYSQAGEKWETHQKKLIADLHRLTTKWTILTQQIDAKEKGNKGKRNEEV